MKMQREEYPKVELPDYIWEAIGNRNDPTKVPKWKYKVSSVNCPNFPTLYIDNEADAYGYYDLYVMHAAKYDWSMGVQFRLETRKGKVLDKGGFVPPVVGDLLKKYAKLLK